LKKKKKEGGEGKKGSGESLVRKTAFASQAGPKQVLDKKKRGRARPSSGGENRRWKSLEGCKKKGLQVPRPGLESYLVVGKKSDEKNTKRARRKKIQKVFDKEKGGLTRFSRCRNQKGETFQGWKGSEETLPKKPGEPSGKKKGRCKGTRKTRLHILNVTISSTGGGGGNWGEEKGK